MIYDALILLGGLGLLVGGADLLVRGAAALSTAWGVSPLVVGLTVVAFGTSTPELAVNLMASFQNNPEISFGNIIGSNIANIGLIVGCSALIRPLTIQGTIITREIPMMILASLVALITGADHWLRQLPDSYDRTDGIIMLLLFGVFLYYTAGDVMRQRSGDALLRQAADLSDKRSFKNNLLNLAMCAAGLILLIAGSKLAVDSAVSIAAALHVPRVIIGLTIVAVGTSLPELATSLTAAWKGQSDIAVGNVVGSNIFNILFITGLCAAWKPIPVPAAGGRADLYMMTFLSLLLLPMCITDRNKIVRWEGLALLLCYALFSTWRVFGR